VTVDTHCYCSNDEGGVFLTTTILGTVGALFLGAAVGSVTLFGLVDSQTSPSGASPGDVNKPVVEYGATQ
jgi:hypothetical protein